MTTAFDSLKRAKHPDDVLIDQEEQKTSMIEYWSNVCLQRHLALYCPI